ncbi:aromatic ring-opening dioxygenase LigA [Burkholderia pseudomallei]|uniref:aromatic ring-opening dioxygenase LigA n=1 Tax=Burkholderia pseudomallei TaxID=28450 RepID=UPI001E5381AB|nr:aromatic ring-opening dioxygenase LigA [Burkholderia pseudomallei]
MINDRAARRAMLEARRCARGIDTPRLSSTGKRIAIIAGFRDARGARLNDDRRTRRARIGPERRGARPRPPPRSHPPRVSDGTRPAPRRRKPAGGSAASPTRAARAAPLRAGMPMRADATSCAVPARRAPVAAPNSLMVMGGARARAARAAMR